MTDAALPLTSRSVERFVERYLSTLGATIEKPEPDRWRVSLAEDSQTELDLDGATLHVPRDGEEPDGEYVVSPASPFVQRLLDEAAQRQPTGKMTLVGETLDLRLPPWLTTGDVEVVEQSFAPYYDRKALCGLFHASIETVSEYETEELRAVAIDTNTGERLTGLEETYLELTDVDPTNGPEVTSGADLSRYDETVGQALEVAEKAIRPVVREVREKATRASNVELSEYQQYQQERLRELTDEADRLADRVEEANAAIDTAETQQERMEALRERKALRSELSAVEAERDEVAEELDAGFPEKRRDVRDRHSITVRLRPVALTLVTFERGELVVTLTTGGERGQLEIPYAVGVGATEEIGCGLCGHHLSEQNPPIPSQGTVVGESCCST
jgi:predicted house-cleaning noncanonical NTP pyrophosphatase (MazG superfamily)